MVEHWITNFLNSLLTI